MSNLTNIFSKGLKPPTRRSWKVFCFFLHFSLERKIDAGRRKTRHALKEVEKILPKVLSGKTEDLEAPIFHGPMISDSEGWSPTDALIETNIVTVNGWKTTFLLGRLPDRCYVDLKDGMFRLSFYS